MSLNAIASLTTLKPKSTKPTKEEQILIEIADKTIKKTSGTEFLENLLKFKAEKLILVTFWKSEQLRRDAKML